MLTVLNSILQEKLIVIVRGLPADKLLSFAEAVCRGGVRLLELTYSANGSCPDEETAENIRLLAEQFAGRMHIGAGTVLTERQVELTRNAGGTFIISPNVNEAVIRKTKELGLISIPGALTPTEVQTAHEAGADFVKLFPVGNLGPGYLKAVAAPLSHVKYLAVGGIHEKNARDYLDAGACGVGVGGGMTDKALIAEGRWDKIEELAASFVAALQ